MMIPNSNENSLTIPRRFGGDSLVYTISTLPDVDITISELMGEHCKANIWQNFALAYYQLQKFDEFQKVLEKGIEFGKKEHSEESSEILKLHDTFTSYQILRGCKETEKVKKSQYFSKAMEHLNQGDEIFKYDENHLLQRGFYLLYEGQKLDHAEAQFRFVTNMNEENILALIGYACVLYNKKNYTQSLKLFKKVLLLCPKAPGYVRLGIGYCLLKLGYVKKARIAFNRVLELEENNSYALTALSVIDINENTLESTTVGAKNLIKSWKADTQNTSTALELADFLFLRGNYDKSEKYSKIALHLAESAILKGRSYYFVGRSHHQKGEIDLAIKHYVMATNFCGSEFLSPYFGLGQLYASKKEFEKAIDFFEKVLVGASDNSNLKKALIMMYIRSPGTNDDTKNKRTASIKQYFSELLVGENLHDPLLVVEHARFIENENVALSLKEVSRIIDVYKESEDTVIPIELLNNYGVYLFMNNVYTEASIIFSECLSRLKKERPKNCRYVSSIELTLTFNSARTKEELGYTDDAVKLYKILLKWKSSYNEATLRLGKIAEKRSDYKAAGAFYQGVIIHDPYNVDALAALGCLYMKKRNYLEAQKKFETIIRLPGQEKNAYAHLALGMIWLDQLYKLNRNKDRDDENVERAFKMFFKVLKHHPRNVYAGNCVGVLLTFNGNYEEARECFAEVRENLFNSKDPWLNLAYVYGMLKNYLNSIQMYKATIDKFGLDKDPEVLTALGCMYWKKEDYNNAMNCMLQAVIYDPLNLYAKYNLAKTYVKIGLKTMESSNRYLSDLDNAIGYFNEAKNTFNDIGNSLSSSSDIKVKWKYISIEQVTEESSMCQDYLTQANSKRPKIVEIEQAREESRKKQKEIMLKLEEEKLAQMKVQESQDLEKQNRLRDLRNEFLNMNRDALKVSVKDDKRKSGGKREGVKRKKSDDVDRFITSDGEYEEEVEKKKRKTRSSRRKQTTSKGRSKSNKGEEKKEVDEEVNISPKENSECTSKDDTPMEVEASKDKINKEDKGKESSSTPSPTPTVFGPGTDDSSNSSQN